MSYRLEPTESLREGLQRIAYEQIDQAIESLRHPGDDPDAAVHDARKRFKKLRAIVRLVRDEVGYTVYKRENVCFRNAGRELAELRERYVMVATVDDLKARYADVLDEDAFTDLYDHLDAAHRQIRHDLLQESETVEYVITLIEQARQRVADWPIEDESYNGIADSVHRVYKRGCKGLARAYADPTPENFHEWRKRVKYLWYHLRILRPLWPELFPQWADAVHDLSNYLGDVHDMAELKAYIAERPELMADKEARQTLFGLLNQRQQELETAARPLGERIYAEKPKRFVKRMGHYWHVWQSHKMDADA